MAQINTKLDSGLIDFTFEDNEGRVFSKFRINPTDVRMVKRAERWEKFIKDFSIDSDVDDLEQKERELGEAVNEFLGYDSYDDIFGQVGPFTTLPDGTFFFQHILEHMQSVVEPVIEERHKKLKASVDKYTADYDTKG